MSRLAFGKAQHALTDNVVLNFIRTGGNRPPPRSQHAMRPLAMIDCASRLIFELTIRSKHLHRKGLHAQI